MNNGYKIILASSSPRRRDLLTEAGLRFDVIKPNVEEIPLANELPSRFALRASKDKALCVQQSLGGKESLIIIAADTIVIRDDIILGKPGSFAEAEAMLLSLSGRSHEVITGMTVIIEDKGKPTKIVSKAVSSTVTFKVLTTEEIAAYVATEEPMDKAGAYAIQGGARALVQSYQGSYSNVVGLPMEALMEILRPYLRNNNTLDKSAESM